MQSPPLPPLASLTRVMLAVLFGLITVGVVGMHLLSADHQLATHEPAAHHDTSIAVAGDDDTHHHAAAEAITDPGAAGAAVAFLSPAGIDHGCAGCDHHTTMLGACLLALGFGLLWQILAPARGRSWPSLVRAENDTAAPPPAARTYRAALTHLELSISRT